MDSFSPQLIEEKYKYKSEKVGSYIRAVLKLDNDLRPLMCTKYINNGIRALMLMYPEICRLD